MRQGQIIYRAFLVVSGIVLFIALIASVSSLIRSRWQPSHLQRVKESGQLRIVTLYGATTFYPTTEGPAGFEYELATEFARWLKVEPVFVAYDSIATLLPVILQGDADLAAAGLTITDVRDQYLRFSSPYQTITEQVIYLGGTLRPRVVEDLLGKCLEVMASSSHQRTLEILRQRYPQLRWKTMPLDIERLLQRIEAGECDHTIADSHQFATLRRFYPRLKVGFDLSDPKPLAWAFSKNHDGTLYQEAEKFFRHIREDKTLERLIDHYYGYVGALGYVDIFVFRRHFKERLPPYRKFFEQASRQYDWDWRLLAAIAYQESHWNNNAKSPTGVRGIMMMTRQTARHVRIQNRLDPAQTIPGAARYLSQLKARIPKDIPEPDRTWFTLAAYNIGFGHLEDARVLTEANGGDPNRWMDVKKNLPLLTQKQWYTRVKHGYARGYEPVRYVENVRNYYDLLVRMTEASSPPSNNHPLPPATQLPKGTIPDTAPAPI